MGSCHIMRNGRVKYRSTMILMVICFSSALACMAQFLVSWRIFVARN